MPHLKLQENLKTCVGSKTGSRGKDKPVAKPIKIQVKEPSSISSSFFLYISQNYRMVNKSGQALLIFVFLSSWHHELDAYKSHLLLYNDRITFGYGHPSSIIFEVFLSKCIWARTSLRSRPWHLHIRSERHFRFMWKI